MSLSVEDRIRTVVIDTLQIAPEAYAEDLAAGDIPQWDSIANVRLLQNVESTFDISFDVADAIAVEDVGDLIELVRRYTNLS